MRANGAIAVNEKDRRFMNRRTTRDKASAAVLAQTGRMGYLVFDEGVRKSLKQIGRIAVRTPRSWRRPAAGRGHQTVLVRAIALGGLLALAACGPAPAPAPRPDAGGWHEFSGNWTAAGTRRTIPLGGNRKASVTDLRGSLLLAGPGRPGVGFRVEVIALNDSATGMAGRAVWTDERGDQVYSELQGEGTATGNKIAGTFVGGTGRYARATGSYEFSWRFVLEAEDGTVQGQSVGLTGRVRTGTNGTPLAAGEKRP